MAKIKIATDSTADIPKSFCEELNIFVLPLTILIGIRQTNDELPTITRYSGKLLFLHGDRDTLVNISGSQKAAEAYKS